MRKIRKVKVIRVYSPDGEIHHVLVDGENASTNGVNGEYSEAEIRKIAKEEASKPLLLIREE